MLLSDDEELAAPCSSSQIGASSQRAVRETLSSRCGHLCSFFTEKEEGLYGQMQHAHCRDTVAGVPVLKATNHATTTKISTTLAKTLTVPHTQPRLNTFSAISSPNSTNMALQNEPFPQSTSSDRRMLLPSASQCDFNPMHVSTSTADASAAQTAAPMMDKVWGLSSSSSDDTSAGVVVGGTVVESVPPPLDEFVGGAVASPGAVVVSGVGNRTATGEGVSEAPGGRTVAVERRQFVAYEVIKAWWIGLPSIHRCLVTTAARSIAAGSGGQGGIPIIDDL